MMRKIFLIFMTLALGFLAPGRSEAANSEDFDDVSEEHWASGQIGQALKKGYVSGYSDGTFDSEKAVTRAEFIKMVVDALKLPRSQGGSPWYQGYVAAAFEFGLLEQTDSTDYIKPIRRLEIIRIVSRLLAVEEPYQAYFAAFSHLDKGDLPFTDHIHFQNKDLPYIALAYGTGIIGGYPDGTMGLNKGASRAETVVLLEEWLAVRVADPVSSYRLLELEERAQYNAGVNKVAIS
jgi:hypothetical protein